MLFMCTSEDVQIRYILCDHFNENFLIRNPYFITEKMVTDLGVIPVSFVV